MGRANTFRVCLSKTLPAILNSAVLMVVFALLDLAPGSIAVGIVCLVLVAATCFERICIDEGQLTFFDRWNRCLMDSPVDESLLLRVGPDEEPNYCLLAGGRQIFLDSRFANRHHLAQLLKGNQEWDASPLVTTTSVKALTYQLFWVVPLYLAILLWTYWFTQTPLSFERMLLIATGFVAGMMLAASGLFDMPPWQIVLDGESLHEFKMGKIVRLRLAEDVFEVERKRSMLPWKNVWIARAVGAEFRFSARASGAEALAGELSRRLEERELSESAALSRHATSGAPPDSPVAQVAKAPQARGPLGVVRRPEGPT